MPIRHSNFIAQTAVAKHRPMLVAACALLSAAAYPPSANAADVHPSRSGLTPCATKVGRIISTDRITLPIDAGEHTAEVGESLIVTAQENVVETGLILTRDLEVRGRYAGADFVVTLPATDLRTAPHNSDLIMMPNATFRYLRERGDRHGLSKPDLGLYLDPSDANVLKLRLLSGFTSRDFVVPDPQLDRIRCLALGTGGFRREIIYSGAAKGVVSLQYREYVDDVARPAFSQELTYDLANGNEIGVKGARIKIVKVTNVGVSYTVLKPLD